MIIAAKIVTEMGKAHVSVLPLYHAYFKAVMNYVNVEFTKEYDKTIFNLCV